MDTGKTNECNCTMNFLSHVPRAHRVACPVRMNFEERMHNTPVVNPCDEPAYFCVEDAEPVSKKEWKIGDHCLASFKGKYRPFVITNIRNQYVSLHALTKEHGERITIRTLRVLDDLEPLPRPNQPEKTMFPLLLNFSIAGILVFALVGMIVWIFFPDKMKDK